jgi:hypothetical protein
MHLSLALGVLQISQVASSRVELAWKDNAKSAVACIVQWCTGSDCADLMNAIDQAGANITTAIDPDVKPGEAYRYRVYAVLPTLVPKPPPSVVWSPRAAPSRCSPTIPSRTRYGVCMAVNSGPFTRARENDTSPSLRRV